MREYIIIKMVIKKKRQPLKPKLSKIVYVPKDKIVSPPKRKTKQVTVKKSRRARKHKRTVVKK